MAVLVATVIMGLMAPPMMQLALLPVQTARQKSNFSLAEANAIAVRKQAAAADSLQGLTLPEGCSQKADAIPTGSSALVENFVECTSGEGKSFALAWQPLYLSSDLGSGSEEETDEEANICYSLYEKNGHWVSDTESKRLTYGGQNVFRGSASEVGRIALATKAEPGKSIPSQSELYLRVHDISTSECSRVDASVKPPQIVSDSQDDPSSQCVVEDYEDRKFDRDPAGSTWNDAGRGGIFLTDGWKNKNSKVDDQDPPAGSKVDCSTPLKLEF
ncbi:MAG: hypothetical protein VKJ66_08000 [Synechococcus sp.]|nr:hypothetical protein [Synechococcus sp.]